MFRRIVVPLDDTQFSAYAIDSALAIGGRTGAAIELVHVHLTEPGGDLPYNFTPLGYELAAIPAPVVDRDRVQESVRSLRARADALARRTGLRVTSQVLLGRVGDTLQDEVLTFGADLIVMATHARSGLERLRYGSVARALVQRSGVPVLLVQPPVGPWARGPALDLHRILVPLDGSAFSEQSLPAAVGLADAFDGGITLLHVEPGPASRGRLPPDSQVVHGIRVLEAAAARCARALRPPHLEVVASDRPEEAILEVAGRLRADAIAMATHGRGGLSRLFVGSTADRVLTRTRLPVLLVRPRAEPVPVRSRAGIATYGHVHA